MTSKNEEKAHTMLNRWVAIKKQLNSTSKDKRPKNPLECPNLQECELWKREVTKEIINKVSDIQNASLGEFKIRELNDEINKLFKEKSDWEKRIKDLGGPDYQKLAPKTVDAEGYEVPNSGGYKYWGAAKDLPGVRELFAVEAPSAPKKSIADIYKNIDKEYYGDCFEEGVEKIILEEEKKEEERLKNTEIIEEGEKAVKKRKIDEKTYIEVEKDENKEIEEFEAIHNFLVGQAGEMWNNEEQEEDMKEDLNNNNNKEINKEINKEEIDIEMEKELIKRKKEELLKMIKGL